LNKLEKKFKFKFKFMALNKQPSIKLSKELLIQAFCDNATEILSTAPLIPSEISQIQPHTLPENSR